jgi:hypothetical protein
MYVIQALAVLTCWKHQGFHLILAPAILPYGGHYCWVHGEKYIDSYFLLLLCALLFTILWIF